MTALQCPLQFGAEPPKALKEFWVWQDFIIRLGPGELQRVSQKGGPQRFFQPTGLEALRDFRFEMTRRFIEERIPIIHWIGQPQIREATL